MKKIVLLVAIQLSTLASFSQSAAWTRSDKELVYNDCLAYLSSTYKQLTDQAKENIAICYVQEFTKKNTKEDYQSMIEPVLKRLRSATITECSKNLGIDLAAAPAPVQEAKDSDVPTKENLVGHWKEKSEDREFDLSSMGTFTMMNEGKRMTGKWQVDGMKLTLFYDRFLGAKERVYDIQIYKKDNFLYTSAKGSYYNVVRVK